MSSATTITKEISPPSSAGRSKKDPSHYAIPVVMPKLVSKSRSPQRQRECLSDWNHAS